MMALEALISEVADGKVTNDLPHLSGGESLFSGIMPSSAFSGAKGMERYGQLKNGPAGDIPLTLYGKKFTCRNNPQTGRMDIYDSDGEHIGVAPSVVEAKRFLTKEIEAGNL